MTNKNLPDLAADKRAGKADKDALTSTPEMGSSRSVNQGGNSGSHPKANDDRRDPARNSDTTVPNPGRDITTGSGGFDGQGRERNSDVDRSPTNAERQEPGVDGATTNEGAPNDQRKI